MSEAITYSETKYNVILNNDVYEVSLSDNRYPITCIDSIVQFTGLTFNEQNRLNDAALIGHTHIIGDINDLSNQLNLKANESELTNYLLKTDEIDYLGNTIVNKPTIPSQLAQLATNSNNQRYSQIEKNKVAILTTNGTGDNYLADDATYKPISGVAGSATWGGIGGNITLQTDLQAALTAKANQTSLNTTNANLANKADISTLNNLASKSDLNGYTPLSLLNDYALKTDVPNDLSDLSDDATHRLLTDTQITAFTNKANISDIPTKTSQLQNDSNFVNDISGKVYSW